MKLRLATIEPAPSSDRTREPRPEPIEVVPWKSPTMDRVKPRTGSGGRWMVPIVGFGLVFPYFRG